MDIFSRALVEAVVEAFPTPEPVIEIGSFRVAGQEEIANLRSLFIGKEYIGCDARSGPGVDRIENAERLSFEDGSVGTLVCLNVLEHIWDVMAASHEMVRVVKPGGIAVVSTVFHFHIHNYPDDYWRFTPEGLWRLLEGFPKRLCGQQGYRKTPRVVFAIGFKPPLPDDFEARCQEFEKTLFERGRRQFNPWRMLRYRLGSLLFGKRPFRDYLHYNDILLKK